MKTGWRPKKGYQIFEEERSTTPPRRENPGYAYDGPWGWRFICPMHGLMWCIRCTVPHVADSMDQTERAVFGTSHAVVRAETHAALFLWSSRSDPWDVICDANVRPIRPQTPALQCCVRFLPCDCEAYARSCYRRLSVCLSVCLSSACIVTKRKHLAKKVQLWLIGSRPQAFQWA